MICYINISNDKLTFFTKEKCPGEYTLALKRNECSVMNKFSLEEMIK